MSTYNLRHTTRYEYEGPVSDAHHVARLRPRRTEYQQVLVSDIEVKPKVNSVSTHLDYFGNETDAIEVLEVHDCLEVNARSVVAVSPRPLAVSPPRDSIPWEEAALYLRGRERSLRDFEFSLDSPLVRVHAMLSAYAAPSFAARLPLIDAVIDLNRRINTDFTYDPAATDTSTPLAQVLREKRGVCQDFAHVAIGCLRSLGLAARYVSGYLETQPPPGQARLVGADASHAWASVYVPDLGWLDFDPTNNMLPSERHITVAWGRDFSDVTPLKGMVLGGGAHTLTVGVDVEPRTVAGRSSSGGQSQRQTSSSGSGN
jgi:transglutaminase-like putative cysteine protease